MNIGKGLACSIGLALAASALWAGSAYLSGWSLWPLMVLVGAAAGIGMRLGLSGRGGVGPALLASLAALASVLVGSAVASRLSAEDFLDEELAAISDGPTLLAPDIHEEFVEADREMSEPADDANYPPEVLAEARDRWNAMPPAEQEAALAHARAEFDQGHDAAAGVLTIIGVIGLLGLKGVLVLGFSVVTAYRIAAHPGTTDPQADEPAVEAPPSSGFFGSIGREAAGPVAPPEAQETPRDQRAA